MLDNRLKMAGIIIYIWIPLKKIDISQIFFTNLFTCTEFLSDLDESLIIKPREKYQRMSPHRR